MTTQTTGTLPEPESNFSKCLHLLKLKEHSKNSLRGSLEGRSVTSRSFNNKPLPVFGLDLSSSKRLLERMLVNAVVGRIPGVSLIRYKLGIFSRDHTLKRRSLPKRIYMSNSLRFKASLCCIFFILLTLFGNFSSAQKSNFASSVCP